MFFSFINSADAFHWERIPARFIGSRIFEYTEKFIIKNFSGELNRISDSIQQYPVIFSVEIPHGEAARVGWIKRIEWIDGDPLLYFEFDPKFRPISAEELESIQWELGIKDFELHRTHWSVKQGDLISILNNRGFAIEAAPCFDESVITPSDLTETRENKSSTSVFVSYSHKDTEHLRRLQVHLRPLKRWLELKVWDDTQLKGGDKWKDTIRKELSSCSVAILLVSADFLASEFIADNELPPLLQKAKEDGVRIIPLIISPCLFSSHPDLHQFQAINSPDASLISLSISDQEALWVKLANTVLDCVRRE